MGGAGSRREGPREGLGRPPQIGSVGRGLALGKGKGHGRRWARTRVTATGTYSEKRSRSMNSTTKTYPFEIILLSESATRQVARGLRARET